MLLSMTGFGAAQGHCDGVEYSVEIRSVNHRYFKPAIKLPEVWSPAEAEIEKLLRRKLQRGSIALTVRMKISDAQAAHRVNTAALASYVDQLRELQAQGDPTLRTDLAGLLLLPGVCTPPPLDELREKTRDELMKLLDQAVDELLAMRAREGADIEKDLLAQCGLIAENLTTVTEWAPQVVKDYQQRLSTRVEELTRESRLEIDAEHLAREVAIFAERCDVNEELSRLAGHLGQFREVCGQQDEPVGRKLDFIAQEMLREVNTIGSKANDADIARAVVEMKAAVDRIKEQVQNVV